jgi:ferredoxin
MRFNFRYPLNKPGNYYTDDRCIDCDFCAVLAPLHFKRDDITGFYYVYNQPNNNEEENKVTEALEACPTQAIHGDGGAHDWQLDPILDWNMYFQAQELNTYFNLPSNILSYENFKVDGRYNCNYEDG